MKKYLKMVLIAAVVASMGGVLAGCEAGVDVDPDQVSNFLPSF